MLARDPLKAEFERRLKDDRHSPAVQRPPRFLLPASSAWDGTNRYRSCARTASTERSVVSVLPVAALALGHPATASDTRRARVSGRLAPAIRSMYSRRHPAEGVECRLHDRRPAKCGRQFRCRLWRRLPGPTCAPATSPRPRSTPPPCAGAPAEVRFGGSRPATPAAVAAMPSRGSPSPTTSACFSRNRTTHAAECRHSAQDGACVNEGHAYFDRLLHRWAGLVHQDARVLEDRLPQKGLRVRCRRRCGGRGPCTCTVAVTGPFCLRMPTTDRGRAWPQAERRTGTHKSGRTLRAELSEADWTPWPNSNAMAGSSSSSAIRCSGSGRGLMDPDRKGLRGARQDGVLQPQHQLRLRGH